MHFVSPRRHHTKMQNGMKLTLPFMDPRSSFYIPDASYITIVLSFIVIMANNITSVLDDDEIEFVTQSFMAGATFVACLIAVNEHRVISSLLVVLHWMIILLLATWYNPFVIPYSNHQWMSAALVLGTYASVMRRSIQLVANWCFFKIRTRFPNVKFIDRYDFVTDIAARGVLWGNVILYWLITPYLLADAHDIPFIWIARAVTFTMLNVAQIMVFSSTNDTTNVFVAREWGLTFMASTTGYVLFVSEPWLIAVLVHFIALVIIYFTQNSHAVLVANANYVAVTGASKKGAYTYDDDSEDNSAVPSTSLDSGVIHHTIDDLDDDDDDSIVAVENSDQDGGPAKTRKSLDRNSNYGELEF
jgi:hypothetical protein